MEQIFRYLSPGGEGGREMSFPRPYMTEPLELSPDSHWNKIQTRLHHQVVAHGADSKDTVAIVILVTVVMLVSVVMLVAAIMLQLCHYSGTPL